VFNKIDRLPPGEGARLARGHGACAISAEAPTGLSELIQRAETMLFESRSDAMPAPLGAAGRG
jgi:50S ribosomal subunit-associated GTPase HflX